MLTGRRESSPPKAGHHADGQVRRHRLLRPSVGMLGISLAEKLKVKVGEPVKLIAPIMSKNGELTAKSAQFTVGAVFDSGISFFDKNLVYMDLGRAQDFFGRGRNVDGIEVHLANLDATRSVTTSLRNLFPYPYRIRNWIEFNQAASAGFEMLKRVYSIVLSLLIGVAAFNLVATLIMIVMEKRKDVAILMAMGATSKGVRLIFILKGLVVGAIGTAAGLILGGLGCFLLARYQFIHIPREVYGMATVPVRVEPASFAVVAVMSMLLCLIATLYPARQASRQMPVEVIRYE